MTSSSFEIFLAIGLASACQASAAWLGYRWILPAIRDCLEYPVKHLLVRAEELGFDLPRLQNRLWFIEFSLLTLILFSVWHGLGILLGGTLLLICFHLRAVVLGWMVERREQWLRSQILVLTNKLDNLFGSSETVLSAVRRLASPGETPEPLGPFIQGVARDVHHNLPLADSLRDLSKRLKIDAFSLLVAALCRVAQHGIPSKSSLAGVRETLENREHIEQQIQAKTASARSQIKWLAIFPVPFLALLGVFMPQAVALLFTDPNGRVVLVVIVWLVYLGAVLGRRLLNIR